MIPRVLEPEGMETADAVRQYDAMDHSVVNAVFVADFLVAHGPCRGGEILDVGTGTARIPISLTNADRHARVVALDLSQAMLAQAEVNIAAALMASRIRLYLGDAKALREAFGPARFEGVISNTIVHHIPDPAPALAEMADLVAPGGTLLVRDLARPDSMDDVNRLTHTYAGLESPEARALFEASLNAALTLDEIRFLIKELGLLPETVTMTSDRHWTWVWHKPQ